MVLEHRKNVKLQSRSSRLSELHRKNSEWQLSFLSKVVLCNRDLKNVHTIAYSALGIVSATQVLHYDIQSCICLVQTCFFITLVAKVLIYSFFTASGWQLFAG